MFSLNSLTVHINLFTMRKGKVKFTIASVAINK